MFFLIFFNNYSLKNSIYFISVFFLFYFSFFFIVFKLNFNRFYLKNTTVCNQCSPLTIASRVQHCVSQPLLKHNLIILKISFSLFYGFHIKNIFSIFQFNRYSFDLTAICCKQNFIHSLKCPPYV